MRSSRVALALTVALLVAITGCSRQVTGTAAPDPRKPGVVLSDDGYGIVAGFDNAPVKVEIFTEPQCTHCADLQADFGDDIGRYINLGQLAVTYRPLTFLDLAPDGHSARVSNAMFLAADPAASATSLQAFVQALWASQARFGEGPSDDEIADLAREAGLPGEVVDRIAAGESALDVEEMADTNFAFLFDADPLDTGTPTVYDAEKGEIIEIYENNWLSKLMASA